MDDVDSQLPRMLGIAHANRATIEQHLAAVGLMHAAKNLDQGRLAGAVLADQRRHLARIQSKIGVAQRVRAAEGFLYLRQRQDGLRGCLLDRRGHIRKS